MEQMTVGMLVKLLLQACKQDPQVAYKKIIVADDEEGNSYHGMYYHPTTDAQEVKKNIEYSNGVYDTDTEDPEKLVILG